MIRQVIHDPCLFYFSTLKAEFYSPLGILGNIEIGLLEPGGDPWYITEVSLYSRMAKGCSDIHGVAQLGACWSRHWNLDLVVPSSNLTWV